MVIIGVIFATALSVATLKDNAVLAAHLEEIVDFIKKVILT